MRWKVHIELLDELTDPISIRFVWVGSAESNRYDQVLDEFDVGPFPIGHSQFDVETDGPAHQLVPPQELIGVTILQVLFAYRGQLFFKVGYYTQTAFFDEALNLNPPSSFDPSLLGKYILMGEATATSFPITWHDGPQSPAGGDF